MRVLSDVAVVRRFGLIAFFLSLALNADHARWISLGYLLSAIPWAIEDYLNRKAKGREAPQKGGEGEAG